MRTSAALTVVFLLGLVLFGVQAFSPTGTALPLTAEVDIKPDTLNVNMRGKWITAYLHPPEGSNASDIDPQTIRLEGLFGVEWSTIEGEVLMIKFDASAVTEYLLGKLQHMALSKDNIELTVEGQLKNGMHFIGIDTLTVMNPPFETK